MIAFTFDPSRDTFHRPNNQRYESRFMRINEITYQAWRNEETGEQGKFKSYRGQFLNALRDEEPLVVVEGQVVLNRSLTTIGQKEMADTLYVQCMGMMSSM